MYYPCELYHLLEDCHFDLYEFFLNKAYERIVLEDGRPIDCFILLQFRVENNFFLDIANGHLDLLKRPNDYTWGGEPHVITDNDIYSRLWFCDTDKDIWDMFLDLPDYTIADLYNCYAGKKLEIMDIPSYLGNPLKAQLYLDYINDKRNEKR